VVADVFIGEQNVLNKTAAGHNIPEISQSVDLFFLYFRPSYQLL
jgi:hypothetical protein